MLQKKLLAAAIAAIGFAAFPAASQEVLFTEIDSPPPAMKVEVVPAARAGYFYTPGYWNYVDRNYVWVEGTFVPERKGYVYVAPRYEQKEGKWRMYSQRWVTEEEHGGTRNRIAAAKDKAKAKIKSGTATDLEKESKKSSS
jgi:YXWGXW repeat-containing protein